MVITRATDYAVRILTALFNSTGTRLKIGDLAALTSVPRDYVPKVLAPLVRRGWVQSHRGPGGGFSFVGGNHQIALLDVVELFEGRLHLQVCTGQSGCQFSSRCPMHEVWLEAEGELRRVLAKYNIAELAAHSRDRGLFALEEGTSGRYPVDSDESSGRRGSSSGTVPAH